MRSNLRQYFRFNIHNNNISKRNSESTSFISIVMIFTLSDVRVKQQQHTKNGVIFGQDTRRTNLIAAVRVCTVGDLCCCHYNISSNSIYIFFVGRHRPNSVFVVTTVSQISAGKMWTNRRRCPAGAKFY
jgi:hypothetical protein